MTVAVSSETVREKRDRAHPNSGKGTLFGVYQVTLSQGHKCVRIVNCKHFFSLVLAYCGLNVVRLPHTLDRSSAVSFVWLVCI